MKAVTILTGSMMVVEAVGGIITNSLALLSDAFHIWQITSGMYSMTCHLVLEEMPLSESGKILHQIHHLLDEKFHITHANIQMEEKDYKEEHKH